MGEVRSSEVAPQDLGYLSRAQLDEFYVAKHQEGFGNYLAVATWSGLIRAAWQNNPSVMVENDDTTLVDLVVLEDLIASGDLPSNPLAQKRVDELSEYIAERRAFFELDNRGEI